MEANSLPRKSCDLCYNRKIKCDGQKPRCSNCIAYDVECKHTAPSRRSKPKSQRNRNAADLDEIKLLRSEIQHLRTQLDQHTMQQHKEQAAPPNSGQNIPTAEVGATPVEYEPADDYESTTPMGLPPLEQAMSLLGIFLTNFNSILPLFNDDALLRLFGECYATLPQQRDPVEWAAINVVLALASQHMPETTSHPCGSSSPRSHHINRYLNQAQSVVSTVMLGKIRLLNIQVLVGMIMVLQTAHDVTPALILMSATIRLAHKISLHNRAGSAHLNPVDKIQHARVFWLAYILDKDLSLRAGQPSLQLDDDVDIDLPSALPLEGDNHGDNAGVIMTANGNAKMNYFLMRVHLANIEGGVYDYLYSTRSLKRTPEERSLAIESIADALEKWQASIPPEFNADVVTSNTNNNPAVAGFFCVLHAASLACITHINRAHAWDKQWLKSLRDHGRGTEMLQLPPKWEPLVVQARAYALLFSETWSKDAWFKWMTGCSYTSSMVLMTTNNLCYPQHDNIQQDIHLVDAALRWLDGEIKHVHEEETQRLLALCDEVVRKVRQKRAEALSEEFGGGRFVNFLAHS
ncbi:unnamed protein product [Clonostachys rosea]|uniref:Zn(2)-C6 fungal-type domain-containing protein n=1 Tax=Bionectria ochroleuca TaxID=29856 RepID=A0ABY6V0G6_BIOOC|nr:unnamed protein product [Clonostachys rosea]